VARALAARAAWSCFPRAHERRAAILDRTLVARDRESKARAPGFGIGVIDGAGA
jgi:hypothetical protein